MAAPTTSPESVRVLVIEDNADDRELLLRQLRKAGMEAHVKFISDGREALEYLIGPEGPAAESLLVILLDLRLPSMSGLELLRQLRARPHFHDVPVTVMTSSNDPNDLDECRRLNVLSYVNKPVTLTSFAKAVADVFHSPRTGSPESVSEKYPADGR